MIGLQMPVDQTNSMPKAHRWRGAHWALIASLALNALFIGGIVSAIARYRGGPFIGQGLNAQHNLGAYVATLPADRSTAIWREAGEKRRFLNQNRRVIRQARDEALVALTAEPFEKDRFIAAQTRLIDAEHAQKIGQRDVLAGLASSMTLDERRAFTRWRGPPRSQSNEPAEPPIPTKQ